MNVHLWKFLKEVEGALASVLEYSGLSPQLQQQIEVLGMWITSQILFALLCNGDKNAVHWHGILRE